MGAVAAAAGAVAAAAGAAEAAARRRRWRRLLVVTNLMCQVMSIIGVCTAETALGCRVVRARVQCGIRASNVCVSAVGWHVRCRLLVNWWRRRRRRRR